MTWFCFFFLSCTNRAETEFKGGMIFNADVGRWEGGSQVGRQNLHSWLVRQGLTMLIDWSLHKLSCV